MRKIKNVSFFTFFLLIYSVQSQTRELNGQLIANDDVEGIHILNRTSAKYAISKEDGSFVILAKASDTLFVSGLKYQNQEFIITQSMMDLGSFSVRLIEKINELSEVIVGKILTGSLQSDLENSDAKPEVNFYDLGIPGFTGKPLTQNERKLHDADAGPMGYIGLRAGVNFHKLLNKVSGRTKKLKAIVELDEKDKCMKRIRDFYSESLFDKEEFTEPQKADYFYFCMDDLKFKGICNRNDPSEVIPFLNEKLKAYKQNLNSKDD